MNLCAKFFYIYDMPDYHFKLNLFITGIRDMYGISICIYFITFFTFKNVASLRKLFRDELVIVKLYATSLMTFDPITCVIDFYLTPSNLIFTI